MKEIFKIIDKTTVKFIIVGIINTIVGTMMMLFMYNIVHANYWISSAMNYIVGSIVSYFLNKYFTFQNKEKSIKVVVRFVVNILICYLIAYGMAKPLVRLIFKLQTPSIVDNVSMMTGMVFFVGLNYMGQKFFVFKNDYNNEEDK